MPVTNNTSYRSAFIQYLRKGVPIGIALKTTVEHPTTHYIWRTREDGKVRSAHAANNGKVFSWDTPPITGHPGESYGCRCTAEPYISGVTEFAQQNIISPIFNTPNKWSVLDFGIHYYFGSGKAVSLSEIGHLEGVIDHYFYNIVRNGTNLLKNINTQIINEARHQPDGNISYNFYNSYPEFKQYMFLFGGSKVSGNFYGSISRNKNMLYIQGTIDYRYQDTFTDILSIREKLTHHTSDPLNASIVALLLTDFYGVFFDIIGSWQTTFYAEVQENAQDSAY